MKAIGVVSVELAEDVDAVRPVLDHIAERHDLTIIEVFTFDPVEPGWVFRLLETIGLRRAHAVVVESLEHVHEAGAAVRGIADLHSRAGSWQYRPSGGQTRASELPETLR
ncbi:hypothetical protein [Nocardia bovistercoris]|uniref:Uncharacterized protein n=1 Tax=Nocardia bovistercoris TaxID=2785916 RepID=A0A931IDZ4_9NOCA|nr:hypothetical protein [Nocardia bovistercoris]MBH0778783.1 hypothetical protein [Nocardia bovistercoris]